MSASQVTTDSVAKPSYFGGDHVSSHDICKLLRLVEPRLVESDNSFWPLPVDPVFMAIDYEWRENNNSRATEIGISIIDTRELKFVATSSDVERKALLQELIGRIRSKHYRTRESLHWRNRYCPGNPEGFVFGESKIINERFAAEIVNRVIQDPSSINKAHIFSQSIEDTNRNIIWVGHGFQNDLKLAKSTGVKVSRCVGLVNTQNLPHLAANRTPRLAHLIEAEGLDTEHLHNAGNDAAYTLRAMLSIAVRESVNVAKRIEESRGQSKNDGDEWDLAPSADKVQSPVEQAAPATSPSPLAGPVDGMTWAQRVARPAPAKGEEEYPTW